MKTTIILKATSKKLTKKELTAKSFFAGDGIDVELNILEYLDGIEFTPAAPEAFEDGDYMRVAESVEDLDDFGVVLTSNFYFDIETIERTDGVNKDSLERFFGTVHEHEVAKYKELFEMVKKIDMIEKPFLYYYIQD